MFTYQDLREAARGGKPSRQQRKAMDKLARHGGVIDYKAFVNDASISSWLPRLMDTEGDAKDSWVVSTHRYDRAQDRFFADKVYLTDLGWSVLPKKLQALRTTSFNQVARQHGGYDMFGEREPYFRGTPAHREQTRIDKELDDELGEGAMTYTYEDLREAVEYYNSSERAVGAA